MPPAPMTTLDVMRHVAQSIRIAGADLDRALGCFESDPDRSYGLLLAVRDVLVRAHEAADNRVKGRHEDA